MKLSELFTSKDNIQLDKKTLVILRWMANIGQLVSISIVYIILNFKFAFFYCLIIILINAVTNFYLQFIVKENQLSNTKSSLYLLYDLFQLALLLFLTGGVTNPFIILLIIPAITSSTFLTLKSTLNLTIITIVILVVLTINHFPLPHFKELHFHVPNYFVSQVFQ